jgi:flagellar hook-associated protein 2
MAMMNFDGISSGLPTKQMIDAILASESGPLDRLQSRQVANNQKRSALQSIKTAFTNLATSVSALTSKTLSARTVTSSDSSFITATGTNAQSGSYDIKINQLATKARTEINNTFIGNPAEMSVGNVGDSFYIVGKDGKPPTQIELQEGKTSLADLNEAINAKSGETGVSSTIVQTRPGEYRLVLNSTETGEGTGGGKEIGIYASNIANGLGVGTAEANAFTDGVTSTEAKNALFELNGFVLERSSNTVSDAIDGVTINLHKAEPGKTVTLNVAMDTGAVSRAFQDVIDKYNAALRAYKNASGNGGPLANDATMRMAIGQLRTSIAGVLEGAGGEFGGSAALLGMKTERDGTITLDTKMLESALKENPDMVGKVFDKMSSGTKSFLDSLTTAGGGTITTLIDSIDTMNTNLNKQIDNMQAKLDRRKEILQSQFAKLESTIGQMQSAGQALGGLSFYY